MLRILKAIQARIIAPRFCPNAACRYHTPEAAAQAATGKDRWYTPHGRFYTVARGWIERFRCRSCGKTCSTQTFSIHYWTRRTEDHGKLLVALCSGSGLRAIARSWNATLRVVRNRVRRLSRNCLAVGIAAWSDTALDEELVFDGFESFTRSQYHPNNFTIAVGADSQAIYGVVYSALRRKGRMTAAQKRYRGLIDAVWKPPRSIRESVTILFGELGPRIVAAAKRRTRFALRSDEHRSYPPALKRIPELAAALADGLLTHIRVPSTAPRTHPHGPQSRPHSRMFTPTAVPGKLPANQPDQPAW